MNTIHFFAGGNTSVGFCSRFADALPPDGGKRVYFLKGGPGVGKSSFMRRVGRKAEKAGLRVEYFHCSSDPESLDAVMLPQLGVALMDGTAPHVCDPVLPGARDTLVSLGDHLDTARLRPLLGELRDLQSEISARFSQCYHYLAAAGEIDRAGATGREDPRKAATLAEEWAADLPMRGGTGRARRLFGAAYTPKGLVRLAEAEARAGAERFAPEGEGAGCGGEGARCGGERAGCGGEGAGCAGATAPCGGVVAGTVGKSAPHGGEGAGRIGERAEHDGAATPRGGAIAEPVGESAPHGGEGAGYIGEGAGYIGESAGHNGATAPRGGGPAKHVPVGLQARLVTCPPGCRPTLTLRRLSELAVWRGLEPIELADPLLPEETLGLIFPEHGLFFGAAQPAGKGTALLADTLFEPLPVREQERKYDQNIKELLLQRAVEQLRDAKALHDRLEKPYIASMDFLKWQTTLDNVLEEIGLGAE